VSAARKKGKKGYKCGASSGHITNLKQSVFSFDIYGHALEMFMKLTSDQPGQSVWVTVDPKDVENRGPWKHPDWL